MVDRLTIEMRNVRYDRALKRLVAAESVQATAWVRPSDLEVYLEQGGRASERIRLADAP